MSSLKQNPKLALAAGAGAIALVLVAGWFLLLSPTRDEATSVQQDVAAKQVELAQLEAELARPSAAVKVRASDFFRVTKALPDANDMSGILLDVNRLAARSDLAFQSVAPQPAVLGTGSIALPIVVTVQGRFTSVSRFLGDVRSIVRVRNGLLDARGRTYSVTQVELSKPDDTAAFPVVKAAITLNAHSFTPPPPAVEAPPTSTTPSPDGTVAAGVTP